MKSVKQDQTKIIIIVPSVTQPQPPKKTIINQSLLREIALTIITIISWLNPEPAIAILLIKLVFIFLEWLNDSSQK